MQHSNVNLQSADLMQSNNLQRNPHLSHCTQPVLPVLCCRLQHQKHSLQHKQLPSNKIRTIWLGCTCTCFNHRVLNKIMYCAHDLKSTFSFKCLWTQPQHSNSIKKMFCLLSHIKHGCFKTQLTLDIVHSPELFWNAKFQKPGLFPSSDDSSDQNFSFLQQAQPSRKLSSLTPDNKQLQFSKHYVLKNSR
jgi:hypothetical protein